MGLPQELVDIIVDNIYDDIPSLMYCSMAARTFVNRTRTHLFKKIQINPPGDPPFSSCQKFYQLLSSSPHIAPLVEDLCIVTVFSATPGSSWIMADPTLSLVLPLLNLKRISLIENASRGWTDSGKYSMNWSKMEPSLRSALTSVFSSPRLEAVHLRGIVIDSLCQLLSLFNEATRLEEMSLSRLYPTQHELWPESQPWRPQLQSLLINNRSIDGSLSFCPYLLAHVRTLSLWMNWTETNEMIQATNSGRSGGVENLHLYLWNENFLPQEIFGTNLRSLHLFCHSIHAMLCAVLEACPLDTRLEHITLEGSGQLSDHAEFAAIDATVDHVSSLKTINFCYIRVPSPSNDTFDAAVQVALPSLVRRGMLRITESKGRLDDVQYGSDVNHGWE
ncbi:hypothetical protein K438DRAFT_2006701 [Mycena galopus ATCC 62051]|nr:hypothetical protein K438DRAFT_2006701 [Mycena galopus ATCC 62051]